LTKILGPADDDAIALVGVDGSSATYGALRDLADRVREGGHALAFMRAENTVPAVSAYAACMEAGVVLLLLDRDIHEEALRALIEIYQPDLLLNIDAPAGYSPLADSPFGVSAAAAPHRVALHPDLALLLSTSGSTGTPKLVRLSGDAVLHNAQAIAQGLGIAGDDRAISSLPYSYTYGLSVINSHLASGATVVLTDASIVAREFWHAVDAHSVTSIAGVPSSYRMLRQMRWDPARHATLRYATQAGGRLSDEDRRHFIDLFTQAGKHFFVMYGQTEATARMTIAQPEDLERLLATAGRAVPGGALEIVDPDENGVGQVVYRGPNVMMGYAESPADLMNGDEMAATLYTGDLGYLDGDLLVLTGRTKRIVKVFGKRVSLDDVEAWLSQRLDSIAVQGDDAVVVVAVGPSAAPPEVRTDLAEYLGVHPSGVRLARIDELPLMSSGKVDLQRVKEWVA
jgi:acyl-CoA synthetase (AMP-forming)/AMP-acid ligase II